MESPFANTWRGFWSNEHAEELYAHAAHTCGNVADILHTGTEYGMYVASEAGAWWVGGAPLLALVKLGWPAVIILVAAQLLGIYHLLLFVAGVAGKVTRYSLRFLMVVLAAVVFGVVLRLVLVDERIAELISHKH